MKETIYTFSIDSQNRMLIPQGAREVYGISDTVYMKLQVIDDVHYLQISGTALNYYQMTTSTDEKGRIIVNKELRKKFECGPGTEFDSFDTEMDCPQRSLLLRKVRTPKKGWRHLDLKGEKYYMYFSLLFCYITINPKYWNISKKMTLNTTKKCKLIVYFWTLRYYKNR